MQIITKKIQVESVKKIAFVVERYGLEVNGGAELHCRQLAEHMSSHYNVEVLTTTAIDYLSWKNVYPVGIDCVNGITVRRFPVKYERNIDEFSLLSEYVIDVPHKDALEDKWFDIQGPYCPKLINYIEGHIDFYDIYIFMTYLYYTTVKGLPVVANKAILIPTAHDEPAINLNFFKKLFHMPRGIFYNTPEEKNYVEHKFANEEVFNNGGYGGVGIEIPDQVNTNYHIEIVGSHKYIIYVGRIDEGKGCKELLNYFMMYKKNNPQSSDLMLVMIGKAAIKVPKRPDILLMGFVSDEVKFNMISGAQFLVLPSRFESLSMVVLEALALSVPVLVNGVCDVIKGHCIHGNAGLYYESYYEFEGCMNYLLFHDEERSQMGKNGVIYVKENYQWSQITKRLSDMIERIE